MDKKILLSTLIIGIASFSLAVPGKCDTDPDFLKLYDEYCDPTWSKVGSDGSYLSIDTNPYDEDDAGIAYIASYLAIQEINEELNLPEYLNNDMEGTTAMMGQQSETFDDAGVTVSWTYHPDKGMEVTYKLINYNNVNTADNNDENIKGDLIGSYAVGDEIGGVLVNYITEYEYIDGTQVADDVNVHYLDSLDMFQIIIDSESLEGANGSLEYIIKNNIVCSKDFHTYFYPLGTSSKHTGSSNYVENAKETSEEYFNGLFELLEKENGEPILLWSSEDDTDESIIGEFFDDYKQYRWEQNDFNIDLIYLTSESKDEYTIYLAYDDKAVDRDLDTAGYSDIN